MMPTRGKILVVDDEEDMLYILKVILEKRDYFVRTASTGEDALVIMEEEDIELILLDIMMPGLDGFKVLKILKGNPATARISVIMLTAMREASNKVRAFSKGASDYIMKPFEKDELLARVETHINLARAKKELREVNELLEKKVKLRTAEIMEVNKALRKSEERFKDITFSVGDWIWEVDENGVYTYCSEKIYGILGYSPDEIIGKTPFILMPPDEAKRVEEIFSGIAANKESIEALENWNINKHGEKVCLLTNGVPILNEKGNLKGYRGVDKDITEKKLAEKALRESEKRYKHLVENAGLGIVIDDKDGNMIYFNDKFAEMFGYSREEMSVLSHRALVFSNDFKMIERYHKRRMQGEEVPSRYEFRGIQKDGPTIYFEIEIESIIEENKEITGTRSYIWDITRRKRYESALQESEQKYRSLFNESKDAIYITSIDGSIEDVNPALLELFGYSKEEMIEEYVQRTYVNILDRKRFEQEIVTNGFVKDFEVQLRRKNGTEIICLIGSTPRMDKKGNIIGYQGIIRDITNRKRAEERITKEIEKRRNVVVNTTHLIFTPLTILKGNLELIKGGQKELTPDLLDIIIEQAEEMEKRIGGELYDKINQMTVRTTDGFTPVYEEESD